MLFQNFLGPWPLTYLLQILMDNKFPGKTTLGIFSEIEFFFINSVFLLTEKLFSFWYWVFNSMSFLCAYLGLNSSVYLCISFITVRHILDLDLFIDFGYCKINFIVLYL